MQGNKLVYGGSMSKDIQQFKATEDDCVYFYDDKIERYRKICDLSSFNDLPMSVKRQIKAAKEEAVETLKLPTD